MSHHLLLYLIAWLICGLYVAFVMAYECCTSTAQMNWLAWSEGRRMQFREKPACRMETILICWLVAFLLLPFTINTPALIWLWVSLGILLQFLAYLSRPDDTLIDGERWVFEKPAGNRWQPQTRIRSLDEIAGVRVTPDNQVVLSLKRPTSLKYGYCVDMKATRREAVEVAEEISRTTGVPVIAYQPKR